MEIHGFLETNREDQLEIERNVIEVFSQMCGTSFFFQILTDSFCVIGCCLRSRLRSSAQEMPVIYNLYTQLIDDNFGVDETTFLSAVREIIRPHNPTSEIRKSCYTRRVASFYRSFGSIHLLVVRQ